MYEFLPDVLKKIYKLSFHNDFKDNDSMQDQCTPIL